MIFNESKHNTHWPVRTLKDLGTFSRGKSKHRPRNDKRLFDGGTIPLIQTGEVRGAGLYIQKHTEAYNEMGLRQSKLWPTGTLCITIAANIAETALLSYPMCFPDSVVGFEANSQLSSEIYLHYVFTYIQKTIQRATSGSIQDNINIDFLTALKFRIPTKLEQDKIVQILYTLDAKIELNNRINAELETMAKLLYDYWFVKFDFPMSAAQAAAMGKPKLEGKPYRASGGKMVYNEKLKREIPDGWSYGSADFLFSFNPPVTLKDGTEAGFFDMDAVPTHGFMTKKVQRKTFSGGTKFTNGDVVVARITPCLENGKTALITQLDEGQVGFGSTEFIVMRGKTRSLSAFGACLARSEHFRKYAILNMTGTSGRKRIEASVLKTYSLPIPSEKLLDRFEAICEPMFQRMTSNEQQNQELTKLRDWLLPMLMNGQVTVSS